MRNFFGEYIIINTGNTRIDDIEPWSVILSHTKYHAKYEFEDFPTESRHSNGHKLYLSPSRHILYSYEPEFIQPLFLDLEEIVSISINLSYRYNDNVLSINNPDFENYRGQVYPWNTDRCMWSIEHNTYYIILCIWFVRCGCCFYDFVSRLYN